MATEANKRIAPTGNPWQNEMVLAVEMEGWLIGVTVFASSSFIKTISWLASLPFFRI